MVIILQEMIKGEIKTFNITEKEIANLFEEMGKNINDKKPFSITYAN